MNRRWQKKRARWAIAWLAAEVSQSPWWRAKLFAAPEGQWFTLDPFDMEVTRELRSIPWGMFRHHRLAFQVTRLPVSTSGDPWLRGDPGLLLFRFQSTDYPGVRSESANNPDTA